MSLSYTQRNEYLDANGRRCPWCKSKYIAATHAPNVEDGIAIQEVLCCDCKKKWNDIYKLINVKEI